MRLEELKGKKKRVPGRRPTTREEKKRGVMKEARSLRGGK
jgi:hypothetical protein